MRTKWQSGSDCGNASNAGLKGNRLIGNERYLRGKTNPYLSRKIYSVCRRCYLDIGLILRRVRVNDSRY